MKLTFISNVPSFFLSHRLPIGLHAKKLGWQVDVIAGQEIDVEQTQRSNQSLLQQGIGNFKATFAPAGMNPLKEFFGLLSVIKHVRRIKPDIVHTASPKGNLYGGIAARLCKLPQLVVAVSGQGFLFTGQRRGIKRVFAAMYLQLIRWVYAHPNCTVIVQNKDDWQSLLDAKLVKPSQLVLIPGSGVDLSLYANMHIEQAQQIVVLPARMLSDKGVLEFVQAAKILKPQFPTWEFVLVGAADGANPAAIRSAQLQEWVAEDAVAWWGHCSDMLSVYRKAGIVCLPSYREGMPKCLLEAAAAAKPIVTTNVVGCREAISHNETGLLVPVQNVQALAEALAQLIENTELRLVFGTKGRERAQQLFSIEAVIERIFVIYRAN